MWQKIIWYYTCSKSRLIFFPPVLAGVDMLMKAVGKDCTSLFSILFSSLAVIFLILSVHGSWPSPWGKRKTIFRHWIDEGFNYIFSLIRNAFFISKWLLIPCLCQIVLLHYLLWRLLGAFLSLIACLQSFYPSCIIFLIPCMVQSLSDIQTNTMPGWMPNSCWRSALLESWMRASRNEIAIL